MIDAKKTIEASDPSQYVVIVPQVPEPYIDADRAAAFLNTNRLNVIRMARSGRLPAYPLGSGKRR